MVGPLSFGLAGMRFLLSATVVLSLTGYPARADFDAGTRAFDAGDYAAAIAEWRPLAEGGDVAAMRNLGQIYRLGLGDQRNPAEAVKWYRRAADIGFDRAQANLGAMYLEGDGVPQDFGEAAHWFDLAARQGHVLAQYNMGLLYESGLGVPRDPGRALGWFNLAARQGHPESLQKLSDLVQKAPVLPLPPARANGNEMAERATPPASPPHATPSTGPTSPLPAAGAAADDDGLNTAGVPTYDLFEIFRKLLRPDTNAEGDKQPAAVPPSRVASPVPPPPSEAARKETETNIGPPTQLLPPAADSSEPAAPEPLEKGLDEYEQKNYRRALGYWLPLANDGNARAQFLIGRLYYNGEGLPRERTRAYMWWTLAAREDDAEAKLALERLTAEMNETQLADGRTLVENFRPRRN